MRPTRGHLVFYERAWGTTPQRHVADRGRPVGASWEPAALGGNRGDSPRCRPWPPRAPRGRPPRQVGHAGIRRVAARGRPAGAGWVTRGFATWPPMAAPPRRWVGHAGIRPEAAPRPRRGRLVGARGAGRATRGCAARPPVGALRAPRGRPRRWAGHLGIRSIAARGRPVGL